MRKLINDLTKSIRQIQTVIEQTSKNKYMKIK
jgi:hypothetical protein